MYDAGFILTKNKVLLKVRRLLEGVQQQMQAEVTGNSRLSGLELFAVPPKISRGENYLGLPYLILDYPRIFGTEHVLAIRTMFWWGRFFSSTLHLAGRHADAFRSHAGRAFPLLEDRHFTGISPDPWQHHFEADNYRPVGAFTLQQWQQRLWEKPHIKIAAKWPLTDWPTAATDVLNNWKLMLDLCL